MLAEARLIGGLTLVDVEEGADDAVGLFAFIEMTGSLGSDPAAGAVLVADAKIEAELLLAAHAFTPFLSDLFAVVGMDGEQPAEALTLRLRTTGEGAPAGVDEEDVALLVRAEDAGGRGLRECLEGLPRLVILGVRLLAFLDVAQEKEVDAAGGSRQDDCTNAEENRVELVRQQPVRGRE